MSRGVGLALGGLTAIAVVLAAGVALALVLSRDGGNGSERPRPNIVFILTDDLDWESASHMPKLKSLLADRGLTFSNFLLNVALCCPSRAAILRGQYSQNTEIWSNEPPGGGFEKFYALGKEKSTVATWLQDAGYRTALIGKYLNGYPREATPEYVPPGWDEWYSSTRGNAYSEYNYTLNENGTLVSYGDDARDYGTDVYTGKARDFMQRSADEGKPFFVYISVYAPHEPATPAQRHEGLFTDASSPRPPSFNEADMSDKPSHLRDRAALTPQQIADLDEQYRRRLRSLQAVDDMIDSLVQSLAATGQLENTYIFFASDNGFHLGQHRLPQGKFTPYEEDIRVPLIVVGPGVPAGRSTDLLVANVDLAPTWAELAGAKADELVDGRSLVPILAGRTPSTWRHAFLIQHGDPTRRPDAATPTPSAPRGQMPRTRPRTGIPDFQGLRTRDYTYVEYVTGEKELYDLRTDPYQLDNIASKASPALLSELARRLEALYRCSAADCRSAEEHAFASRP